MPEIDPQDVSKLSEGARAGLLSWIEEENSKSKFQQSVHTYTDMCWKKCIKGNITNPTLETNEQLCLSNCLQRFLDTNIAVVHLIQSELSKGA